jgi:hypothetical protein
MLYHFNTWALIFLKLYENNHSASVFAIFFLALATVSWLGLCYDLTTWLHFMHTLAFVLTFSAMAICFYFLLKEPLHIAVWLCGFLAILFTIVFTLFTYITNEANMGPIEHLSFLSYCCTYLAFSLLLN